MSPQLRLAVSAAVAKRQKHAPIRPSTGSGCRLRFLNLIQPVTLNQATASCANRPADRIGTAGTGPSA